MRIKKQILPAGMILACCVYASDAAVNKNALSPDAAIRSMGEVAAYQQFPKNFRLTKMGTVEAGDTYFHIFTTSLAETNLIRTLVFANSGNYLGYYENVDEPVEMQRSGIIYPGPSYSAENGDAEEGEFDSGDAYIITFSTNGPPAEVKFEKKTFSFVSSPYRVRPETPGYRFVVVGERMMNLMNRGRYQRIRDDFSPQAQKRISEAQTQDVFSRLRKRLGKVERLGPPWLQSDDTVMFPITFQKKVMGLKMKLNDDDKIKGLWVQEYDVAFPDIGKNKTPLTLPFDGRWRVMWGGSTRDESKYFGNPTRRYAYEFVVADRYGRTYEGEGKRNEDYYAFGRPVLAPAAGTVVAVISGVDDSPPSAPNPFDLLGNTVLIRHSTNEVSVIGHLMNGSITVKAGDEVEARQEIGRCGNSGDSSQPGIYYHLQNADGLKQGSGYHTDFTSVMVWEKGTASVQKNYVPVRGEYVEQQVQPSEK